MAGKKKTYGHAVDDNTGRAAVYEVSDQRKGSLDFEGTTKRRFGLADSIRTFRAGR